MRAGRVLSLFSSLTPIHLVPPMYSEPSSATDSVVIGRPPFFVRGTFVISFHVVVILPLAVGNSPFAV